MTEIIRLENILSVQQLEEVLRGSGRKQRSVYLPISLIKLAEDLAFILSFERRERLSFNDVVEEALYEKIKRYIEEQASPLKKERVEVLSIPQVSGFHTPIIEEPPETCFFCKKPAVTLIRTLDGKYIRAVCEEHKKTTLETGKWTDKIESLKCSFCEQPSRGFIIKKDERDKNVYPACEQHIDLNIKSGSWRHLRRLGETKA